METQAPATDGVLGRSPAFCILQAGITEPFPCKQIQRFPETITSFDHRTMEVSNNPAQTSRPPRQSPFPDMKAPKNSGFENAAEHSLSWQEGSRGSLYQGPAQQDVCFEGLSTQSREWNSMVGPTSLGGDGDISCTT